MNEDSIRNLLNPKHQIVRDLSINGLHGHYRITAPFGDNARIIAIAGLTEDGCVTNIKRRIWGTIIIALFVQILFISARSATVTAPILCYAIYCSYRAIIMWFGAYIPAKSSIRADE